MEEQRISGRRVTRVAKLATDGMWWLSLIVTVLVVGWLILSPVVMGRTSVAPIVAAHVSLEREGPLDAMPLGSAASTDRISQPVLTETRAELQVHTRDWSFQLLTSLMVLPGLAVVLLGLHLVRRVLRDVLDGYAFTVGNARRLSWLGWLLVVSGVAGPILEYWRTWWILKSAQLSGPALTPDVGTSSWGLIIPGVLMLVLSAAWRYGAELQRERDLTV